VYCIGAGHFLKGDGENMPQITAVEFKKLIKGLSAFECAAAQILLRETGRENMLEYIKGVKAKKEASCQK
jgi:hypothetical protein